MLPLVTIVIHNDRMSIYRNGIPIGEVREIDGEPIIQMFFACSRLSFIDLDIIQENWNMKEIDFQGIITYNGSMINNREALTQLGMWLVCMGAVSLVVGVSYLLIGNWTFVYLLPIAFYGLWWKIKTGRI